MYVLLCYDFFFFKQKTAYEMRISDWSSDVCSSDLISASMQAIIAASIPSDKFSKKDEGNDKAGIRKRCGRSIGWHIDASGGGRGRESCCKDQLSPLGYGNRTSRQNSKQGRFSDGGGAAFAGPGRCTRRDPPSIC